MARKRELARPKQFGCLAAVCATALFILPATGAGEWSDFGFESRPSGDAICRAIERETRSGRDLEAEQRPER